MYVSMYVCVCMYVCIEEIGLWMDDLWMDDLKNVILCEVILYSVDR